MSEIPKKEGFYFDEKMLREGKQPSYGKHWLLDPWYHENIFDTAEEAIRVVSKRKNIMCELGAKMGRELGERVMQAVVGHDVCTKCGGKTQNPECSQCEGRGRYGLLPCQNCEGHGYHEDTFVCQDCGDTHWLFKEYHLKDIERAIDDNLVNSYKTEK